MATALTDADMERIVTVRDAYRCREYAVAGGVPVDVSWGRKEGFTFVKRVVASNPKADAHDTHGWIPAGTWKPENLDVAIRLLHEMAPNLTTRT